MNKKTARVCNSLSDKEIAEYMMQGRGFELLGFVPTSKLRNIQGFLLHKLNAQQEMIRQLKAENDVMRETLTYIEIIAHCCVNGVDIDYTHMVFSMMAILNEISKTKTNEK